MSVLVDSIDQVAQSFTGRLVHPSDQGYDDLRRVHNGLIDKHPAFIARCAGIADIVDAVQLARTLDLEVAVRGGGAQRGPARSAEHDARSRVSEGSAQLLEGTALD